jgi:competence CoiA-like predicted nuclease
MLIGTKKNTNERIVALKENREELRLLTKEKQIICPECGNELILNSGEVKVTYFSHSKCKCTYPYWETESENHIKTKFAIKERLEKLYPNSKVYLEYKVEETNQRSDVMVIHPNNEKWAFEVQLSQISISQLIERSELYQRAGVYDFWLLGFNSSSFHWPSTIREFGDRLFQLEKRCFLLSFMNGIEICYQNSHYVKLKDVGVKKEGNCYKLKNVAAYKKFFKDYLFMKKAVMKHFRETYSSTKVTLDYYFSEYKENANILIESPSGSKCAINIIHPNLPYRDLYKRKGNYNIMNIPVFWLFIQEESEETVINFKHINLENKYSLINKDKHLFITDSKDTVNRIEMELKNIIFHNDVVHNKITFEDKLILKKDSKGWYRNIIRSVIWCRNKRYNKLYREVYICPEKTSVNIEACKECYRFGGYTNSNSKRYDLDGVLCKEYI